MFALDGFDKKKIAVFGLARSGLACCQALILGGAEVCAWDDDQEKREEARAQGIPLVDLREVSWHTFERLVLSPGVPLTHPAPHWTVLKAQEAGVLIVGDTELFCHAVQARGCFVIGITGTNGKSTTTALIGHILAASGRKYAMGGNIGTAVFLLPPPEEGMFYVLELSSYQIDLMPSARPDGAVLLNLTPDHLDRHGTMENYAAVKARIFSTSEKQRGAVCSVDDSWCEKIAQNAAMQNSALEPFSVKRVLSNGFFCEGRTLYHDQDGKQCSSVSLTGAAALRGAHNAQNACAAYGILTAFGVSAQEIERGLASFSGLDHRLKTVHSYENILFVNDSKATNAEATEKALLCFENIYWILGGLKKAQGIDPLVPLLGRVKHAYLIGQDAQALALTLEGRLSYDVCGTLETAVEKATLQALSSGIKEQLVVLLSPSCASFDQYPNFEVRGDDFVACVEKMVSTLKQSRGKPC